MYSCTMPVPAPGGGGGGLEPGAPQPHEEDVSALKKCAHYMCGNGLVEFGVFGWLGVFRWTARRLC